MKRIAIFTMFWGPVYADMFRKYQLPSLMQEGNLPRLATAGYDIKWHIYSDARPPDNPFIVWHSTGSQLTVPCLKDFINSNLDAFCFMIFPDIFVGNNTMYNAIKMVENKPDMCLSVAHPRISLEKLDGKPIVTPVSNAELVYYAFKYAHKCLWATQDDLDPNMTWGGISWRKIDEHNYAVIHNLATPFIFQFKPGDAEFICDKHGGCMDRALVGKLQAERRIKICGSSDLCFFCEITTDKHDPYLRSGMKYNDLPSHNEHGNDESMNAHWNNVIVNWRRE